MIDELDQIQEMLIKSNLDFRTQVPKLKTEELETKTKELETKTDKPETKTKEPETKVEEPKALYSKAFQEALAVKLEQSLIDKTVRNYIYFSSNLKHYFMERNLRGSKASKECLITIRNLLLSTIRMGHRIARYEKDIEIFDKVFNNELNIIVNLAGINRI